MEQTVNNQTEQAPQPEQLVLRTEGLVKIYGKRTVVNDVSFDVRQGEIVGLLGPNGAGKTTSFYMTTGLIVPNGGHIYLGDEEVRAMYDPYSTAIENVPPVRPRIATAPVINRFDIRQDGDSAKICGPVKLQPDIQEGFCKKGE